MTPAQERVMRLRAEGLTTAAVAHRLFLSEQTVKNHCSDVLRDLDVNSTIAAMRALGWITLPGEPMAQLPDDRLECGLVERCTRPMAHRGHHGGFRPVVVEAIA